MTQLADALAIRGSDERSIASIALAMRRAYPFGQFGQASDAKTAGGSTGCTDTVLQSIALLVLGQWFTHDQIRTRLGHHNAASGLTYVEVAKWLAAARLPYQVELGLTGDQILGHVRKRGPVMVGEQYVDHPEWHGYRYRGVRANGKRNGYAQPTAQAGRNQLNWDGRHAVLFLAIAPVPDWGGQEGVYILEPNHDSSARPEAVPYDLVTVAQAKRLVVRYAARNSRSYAAIPTRALSVAA